MQKIALTGNIGSGKSTVAKMFRELGADVVDADVLVKNYYNQGNLVYSQVIEKFGEEILEEDKSISRKKLADIVFNDSEKLGLLEKITHTQLEVDLKKWFSKEDNELKILEAALIFEKSMNKNYDAVIVVYTPYEICKVRTIERGSTEEDFKRRLAKQLNLEEKAKLADIVVDNSGNLEQTAEKVEEVYNRLYVGDSWLSLCKKLGAEKQAKRIFEQIERRYSEPERKYHNFWHVVDMLKEFKKKRHLFRNPEIVEKAIYDHDVVYDPKRNDNEEKSSVFADWSSDLMNLGEGFRDKERKLILASKHNSPFEIEDYDTQLFLGLDLLIFGTSDEKFDKYDSGIKREYSWVEESAYKIKRAEILDGFLKRAENHVLYPSPLREEYEEQAKKNLERAIERLKTERFK